MHKAQQAHMAQQWQQPTGGEGNWKRVMSGVAADSEKVVVITGKAARGRSVGTGWHCDTMKGMLPTQEYGRQVKIHHVYDKLR